MSTYHKSQGTWPYLRRYRQRQLDRFVLPVGGIGTGTIGFAGNGGLLDWEVMNVPAKGFIPFFDGALKNPAPSLLLRYAVEGKKPAIKLLEGPLPLSAYEGPEGASGPGANLPRFRHATCQTAYPLAEVHLDDLSCPLGVRLQVFNPMAPHDAEMSGWPTAFFRTSLSNPLKKAVSASVVFSLPNFIGADGSQFKVNQHSGNEDPIGFRDNVNEHRKTPRVTGLFLRSKGVDPTSPAWGTMSLTTPTARGITHRTSWAELGWGDTYLEFWDELLQTGRLTDRTSNHQTPIASLCREVVIPPGGTVEVEFLLAWHFPNRIGWGGGESGDRRIVNFYTTRFSDAWEVALKYWPKAAKMEDETLGFVRAFLATDSPREIKEAALFNLSTIRTQTCFRDADGRFFAWEGIFPRRGSCLGSCSHVWNYEQGLGQLFPELALSMHQTAFSSMDERGMMPFRIALGSDPAAKSGHAAADGQTGHILRVYREWIGSGDEELFQQLWPKVKRAIEFCWIPGGWDADQNGVMEGCQHNTMDVDYFGPNPQMGFWYLGALRAGARMARHAGDPVFAEKLERLANEGSAWIEKNLFNGDYFEQRILPVPKYIAEGLRAGEKAEPGSVPPLQLGAGCLIDQLVGDWAARLAGLAPLLDAKLAKRTLQSVLKHNRRSDMWGHFNHLRTYVLGDEAGLLMASYPRGNRPARPFPYYNEVMTGFEYVVAGHLILVGLVAEGLKCVRDIRARYDGVKRNPYNEAECGYHYGRALASWGLINAWSGFFYDGVEKSLRLGREGAHFFSCGAGWGTLEVRRTRQDIQWNLKIEGGKLTVAKFEFGNAVLYQGAAKVVRAGSAWQGRTTRKTSR
jgi:non-lysosomal glucosylceramidase